jgi:hypothetical protein
VSLLFGTPAAGLDDLAEFLKAGFGTESFADGNGLTDPAAFLGRLDEVVRREREGTTLVLVPAACGWDERWLGEAAQRLGELTSDSAFVRVLFVADPAAAWRLLEPDAGLPDRLRDRLGLSADRLRPWHDAALAAWLADRDFGPRDAEGRATVRRVTGNWPLLLQEFHWRVQADPGPWERHLQELEAALAEPQEARPWVALLGVEQPEARQVLHALAELGDASAEDLAGLVEGVPAGVVPRALNWAEHLGLAHPVSNGCWRVEPVTGRVLRAAGG